MRAVIQRVSQASVKIEGKTKGEIKHGLLIFLGIEDADAPAYAPAFVKTTAGKKASAGRHEDIEWLSGKISRLRIFDDGAGVMNLSVNDVEGDVLVVSQFTLHASTKKGNRPSYINAAKPEVAIPVYEAFVEQMERDLGKKIETGEFGALMEVSLVNDGPVTIIIDTNNKE